MLFPHIIQRLLPFCLHNARALVAIGKRLDIGHKREKGGATTMYVLCVRVHHIHIYGI